MLVPLDILSYLLDGYTTHNIIKRVGHVNQPIVCGGDIIRAVEKCFLRFPIPVSCHRRTGGRTRKYSAIEKRIHFPYTMELLVANIDIALMVRTQSAECAQLCFTTMALF